MTQLKRALALSALLVFLVACGSGVVEDVETVTVTLTASPAQVEEAGGSVTLTAIVDGTAASVDFAQGDADTVVSSDTDGADGYTAIVDVVPPATYIAVARDADGNSIGTSDEISINAIGTTPLPTDPGQPTDPNEPTPPTPGPIPTPGGPIPEDAVLAASVADINAAAPGATIVLTQDLVCDVDPCIVLKDNQRLLGGRDGQLLTEPGINITATLTSTNPASDLKSTVVTMANGSGVEGINFGGDDIYQAINAPSTVTGDIVVRNVAISTPTANNPINMQSTGGVTIENLTFTSSRPVFIEGFTSATLRGLNLTINRPAEAVGAALTIVAAQGDVLVEQLQLTASPGGTGKDGVLIQSGIEATDAGALNVTVKDSSVTFPDADLATSVAFNFNIAGAGTLTINEPESIGNTTNSTYAFKATYDTGVTGRITLP
jgi:hypothetical protein